MRSVHVTAGYTHTFGEVPEAEEQEGQCCRVYGALAVPHKALVDCVLPSLFAGLYLVVIEFQVKTWCGLQSSCRYRGMLYSVYPSCSIDGSQACFVGLFGSYAWWLHVAASRV